MLQASQLIAHQGGVARGARLQQFGLSRRMLSSAVRDGSIIRVRPGVFAVPSANPDVICAAAHGGAVTCTTALRMHEVWALVDDERLHVWVGTSGRVHHAECACVTHYFEGRTLLGVAPVEDALVHVYHCAGEEAFFAALESALKKRKFGAGIRERLRERLPVGARWLVDFARRDADSGLESLLRLRLHLLGIRLDCQVEIPTVGRADFVIDGMLILEADGMENHDGSSRRHKDLRRDAAASVLGYETLRFDYALIIHDWPVVEAAIIAAISRLRARV
ncbi:type IV toxin-antitoxin system AbiEi family antitoxin domain-containing protein [Microbacterium sp. LWH12-1.2]|uniref:type IV toxin-antitoxin system AbiEi family antitoxin domain-containing protein n=1 Tax=Microbacterium sp. LWH12-1.2 TaxID=3135259 RepID=UPI003445510A